jgi:hypothetical protein
MSTPAKQLKEQEVFPLAIRKGLILRDTAEAVQMILGDSDAQVKARGLRYEEDRFDFQLSCDGLNVWRLQRRIAEDHGDEGLASDVCNGVVRLLCSKRGYDVSDFRMALKATADRVRIPYGISPMQLAWSRAQKAPIRLTDRNLSKVRAANTVAGVSLQLQNIQDDAPIYLPINDLRRTIGQRKIVVSGAVMQLIEAGVLECVDQNYHIGRARKFRFRAKEGEDYVFVEPGKESDDLSDVLDVSALDLSDL